MEKKKEIKTRLGKKKKSKAKLQWGAPLCAPHTLSVSGVEHAHDLPVGLAGVQPLPALEDCCHRVGRVRHLHALQVPPAVAAAVVVLHLDPQQLPEVQHLQDEAVRAASLEKVAQLLPQLPLARVAVGAVDGEEDVGVGARTLRVPGDHDDFVLDRHQVADFAGEALDGLEALERQELVPFGCQRDLCVAVEEIPEEQRDG